MLELSRAEYFQAQAVQTKMRRLIRSRLWLCSTLSQIAGHQEYDTDS